MTTAVHPGHLTTPPSGVAWTPAATADPPVAVEAGTLLAVAPAGAAPRADEGVVALERPDGARELRAGRDGVPSRALGAVAVERLHVIAGATDPSTDRESAARCGSTATSGRDAGSARPGRCGSRG